MKTLKEYILESSQESVDIWDSSQKEDLLKVFKKLDEYIQSNKALYVCSGWWPGTEVECWGTNFEDLLHTGYVRLDHISRVELVKNRLVLYPEVVNRDEHLDLWILKPELAKYLDFEGAGEDISFTARNSSGFSKKHNKHIFSVFELEPLKSAPESFKKIFTKAHAGFAKYIGAQKNTLSGAEIKNILGI